MGSQWRIIAVAFWPIFWSVVVSATLLQAADAEGEFRADLDELRRGPCGLATFSPLQLERAVGEIASVHGYVVDTVDLRTRGRGTGITVRCSTLVDVGFAEIKWDVEHFVPQYISDER